MISSIFGSLFGEPEGTRVIPTTEIPRVREYRVQSDASQNAAAAQQAKMQENILQLQMDAFQEQEKVREGDRAQQRLNQYGVDPHPALHFEIVELLLEYAESSNPYIRRAAVKHRMMPEAKLIMMVGDEDRAVRETVAKIMQYNEENRA